MSERASKAHTKLVRALESGLDERAKRVARELLALLNQGETVDGVFTYRARLDAKEALR